MSAPAWLLGCPGSDPAAFFQDCAANTYQEEYEAYRFTPSPTPSARIYRMRDIITVEEYRRRKMEKQLRDQPRAMSSGTLDSDEGRRPARRELGPVNVPASDVEVSAFGGAGGPRSRDRVRQLQALLGGNSLLNSFGKEPPKDGPFMMRSQEYHADRHALPEKLVY